MEVYRNFFFLISKRYVRSQLFVFYNVWSSDLQKMGPCIFPVCSTLMQESITALLRTEQDDIRNG